MYSIKFVSWKDAIYKWEELLYYRSIERRKNKKKNKFIVWNYTFTINEFSDNIKKKNKKYKLVTNSLKIIFHVKDGVEGSNPSI